MRSRFASLTSRLVVTAVALVVVISILTGVFATLAMQNRLTAQVDEEIVDTLRRPPPFAAADGQDGSPPFGNIQPDLIYAVFPRNAADADPLGYRYGRGRDNTRELNASVLDELAAVDSSGFSTVDLVALGDYRVRSVATDGATIIVGLPLRDVDDAVGSLIGYEIALVIVGGLLAAGAALIVVRRQLRPLTEVAETAHVVSELPLSEGEINLSERVPAHLTDPSTEVGQVGAALNRLLEHVETSLESRHRSELQVRQFVADASHELRTPLATIVGYTELARRRPDEATRSTALLKVEEESARMTALVEDLLLLARLDAAQPLAREDVDLTRVLLEAVSDARVVAPDHQWRLELPEASIEVVGDEQRLHQVVTNLLTNARKHTPAGTMVTVVGTLDGFEVRDDGPGFPPALVDVAFERFARGDSARERTGGAGLGLALVEAIVAASGGTVSLTSVPGDTRITVRLTP